MKVWGEGGGETNDPVVVFLPEGLICCRAYMINPYCIHSCIPIPDVDRSGNSSSEFDSTLRLPPGDQYYYCFHDPSTHLYGLHGLHRNVPRDPVELKQDLTWTHLHVWKQVWITDKTSAWRQNARRVVRVNTEVGVMLFTTVPRDQLELESRRLPGLAWAPP